MSSDKELSWENCNTEDFIREMEKWPAIWDINHDDYGNKIAKKNAWESVIVKFVPYFTDMSVSEKDYLAISYQRKWKSLRDSYTREKSKQRKESKSGSAAKYRKKYVFFEQLRFLEAATNFIEDCLSMSDVDGNGEDSRVVEENENPKNGGKQGIVIEKKRKYKADEDEDLLNNLKTKYCRPESVENKVDSDKLFLQSLQHDLSTLPDHMKLNVKSQMIGVLSSAKQAANELSTPEAQQCSSSLYQQLPPSPLYLPQSRPQTPLYLPKSPPQSSLYLPQSRPQTPLYCPKSPPRTPLYLPKSPPQTPLYLPKSPPQSPFRPQSKIHYHGNEANQEDQEPHAFSNTEHKRRKNSSISCKCLKLKRKVTTVKNANQTEENEFDIFGLYASTCLKKLPLPQAFRLQEKMNSLIVEERISYYSTQSSSTRKRTERNHRPENYRMDHSSMISSSHSSCDEPEDGSNDVTKENFREFSEFEKQSHDRSDTVKIECEPELHL